MDRVINCIFSQYLELVPSTGFGGSLYILLSPTLALKFAQPKMSLSLIIMQLTVERTLWKSTQTFSLVCLFVCFVGS